MDRLLLTVLNMSVIGAFVIAVICLFRLPLSKFKAPKIIAYCLWAVAGVRLLMPFSIEGMWSLLPFGHQPIPMDIAAPASVAPVVGEGANAVAAVMPAETLRIADTAQTAASAVAANPLHGWLIIGGTVWLVGTALMLLYGVVSYVLLQRKMRGAVHLRDNIYEAENLKSPFVWARDGIEHIFNVADSIWTGDRQFGTAGEIVSENVTKFLYGDAIDVDNLVAIRFNDVVMQQP